MVPRYPSQAKGKQFQRMQLCRLRTFLRSTPRARMCKSDLDEVDYRGRRVPNRWTVFAIQNNVAIRHSVRGLGRLSPRSSGVFRCRATRIPATMASTRLRPSSIRISPFVRYSLAPHFDPAQYLKKSHSDRAAQGMIPPIRPRYWIELISSFTKWSIFVTIGGNL